MLDWLTGLCALVALVVAIMALPTVFQMKWGQPRVGGYFFKSKKGNVTFLEFVLSNVPLHNKILDGLGVHTSVAEDVNASLSIAKKSDKTMVCEVIPTINSYDGQSAQRIRLPASTLPASFMVVAINPDGKVDAYCDHSGSVNIPNGLYEVEVRLRVDGKELPKFKNQMVVQDSPPYAYWVSS